MLLSHVKEEADRHGDGSHTGQQVGKDEGESLSDQINGGCEGQETGLFFYDSKMDIFSILRSYRMNGSNLQNRSRL